MNKSKHRVTALHRLLKERFPAAFPRNYEAIRPLKIGIETDILGRLTEAGEPVEPALLRRVLANHTGRAGYLLALLYGRGEARYDLDGRPAGTVDAAARAEAARKLEAIQQRQHAQSERYQAHKRREKELQAAKAQRLAEREQQAEEKRRRREAHERNRQQKLERLQQQAARQRPVPQVSINPAGKPASAKPTAPQQSPPSAPAKPTPQPRISPQDRKPLSLKERKPKP